MSLVRVRLGDVVVGEVERFDDDLDTHVFRWSAEYRTTPERPVLGPYMEDRLDRPLVTHGLTPWFEHLLPQGPLRGAVARDAGVDPSDGLALLAWLGEDLPGAVRVEVVRALRARPRRESVPVTSADPTAVYRVSLPGVQWKLSLHATQKGLTLPTRGVEGEWIAKFHADAFPRIVTLEDATLRWAELVGIDAPRHQVVRCDDIDGLPEDVPRGDGETLVIDRFDRSPSGRIHVEDFGQVLDRPPGLSQYRGAYEELGAVIGALCPDDGREFVRRLVFCCVSGNGDAHLKNWGLRYLDGRRARLSPAYDLVPTVVYRPADLLALSLGGSLEFSSLTLDRFDRLAGALDLAPDTVRGWVAQDAALAREAWEGEGVREAFSEHERARVERHVARVSGLWRAPS